MGPRQGEVGTSRALPAPWEPGRLLLKSLLVVTLAVATALGTLATPAFASNFSGASGGTGCYNNMADNRDHYFYYVSITTPTRDAVNWSRTYNYNPTDVNTHNESNGLSSTTDAVIYDEDYEGVSCGMTWMTSSTSSGIAGLADCRSLSGSRCQRFNVYFDLDFMGPASLTGERSIACHELGHSLGLLHQGSGCMMQNNRSSSSLTDHDRSHLNYWY